MEEWILQEGEGFPRSPHFILSERLPAEPQAGWEENGELGLGSKDGFGHPFKLPGSLWERRAMGVNLPETQCLQIS